MSNTTLTHLGLGLVSLDLGDITGIVVIALYVLAASCVGFAVWQAKRGRGTTDD